MGKAHPLAVDEGKERPSPNIKILRQEHVAHLRSSPWRDQLKAWGKQDFITEASLPPISSPTFATNAPSAGQVPTAGPDDSQDDHVQDQENITNQPSGPGFDLDLSALAELEFGSNFLGAAHGSGGDASSTSAPALVVNLQTPAPAVDSTVQPASMSAHNQQATSVSTCGVLSTPMAASITSPPSAISALPNPIMAAVSLPSKSAVSAPGNPAPVLPALPAPAKRRAAFDNTDQDNKKPRLDEQAIILQALEAEVRSLRDTVSSMQGALSRVIELESQKLKDTILEMGADNQEYSFRLAHNTLAHIEGVLAAVQQLPTRAQHDPTILQAIACLARETSRYLVGHE